MFFLELAPTKAISNSNQINYFFSCSSHFVYLNFLVPKDSRGVTVNEAFKQLKKICSTLINSKLIFYLTSYSVSWTVHNKNTCTIKSSLDVTQIPFTIH